MANPAGANYNKLADSICAEIKELQEENARLLAQLADAEEKARNARREALEEVSDAASRLPFEQAMSIFRLISALAGKEG
jgi:F0F1-type ATP synthase membrane subunit b/b'